LLHEIYDLTKLGPTSANASPLSIVFVKSKSAKEKLLPALNGSNVEQIRVAPVTGPGNAYTASGTHLCLELRHRRN